MDRNFNAMQIVIVVVQSLSARRAWIEIVNTADQEARKRVALRKESVDRNIIGVDLCGIIVSRSPQGERG